MKKILIAVAILAVLAIVAVLYLLGNLGSIIQRAVEKFGSDATQAKVTLASADVSLTSGQGELKGLTIGNPKGFKAPAAFELGEISVKLDTSSVTSDVVVIHEVLIQSPKVTYETMVTSSNLGVLQENVAAYGKSTGSSGGGKGSGGGGSKEKKASSGGEKKYVIENLWVKGGSVEAAFSPLGGKGVTVALPDIHLTDIGKKSDGATAQEVATQVLTALTDAALRAAGGLAGNVREAADNAIDRAKGVLKGVLGK